MDKEAGYQLTEKGRKVLEWLDKQHQITLEEAIKYLNYTGQLYLTNIEDITDIPTELLC